MLKNRKPLGEHYTAKVFVYFNLIKGRVGGQKISLQHDAFMPPPNPKTNN